MGIWEIRYRVVVQKIASGVRGVYFSIESTNRVPLATKYKHSKLGPPPLRVISLHALI
jgi:hypothetical protein